MTVTHKGNGQVYNPSTNTYTTDDLVMKGKGLLSNYDSQLINGTSILAGDVSIMCYIEGGKPSINDKVQIGGKTYTVVNVLSLNPDGSCDIYFKIQGR